MQLGIYFTSLHCTGKYELAKVTGSNPVEARIFSGFFFPIAFIGNFTAMITPHFNQQPQYKYEIFHRYSRTSLIRTPKGQRKVSVLERGPLYRGHESYVTLKGSIDGKKCSLS